MTSLIRKYRVFLSIVFILLAAVAAPYLVPENPDSAIFRSGVLPFLLLLSCLYPVSRALERHAIRSLIYGCAFGFAFAVCLSLGSELSVYSQLLPGLGSLVRRAAVPVMVTPLFGVFASYAFSICPNAPAESQKRIPYPVFFSFIALCYGAILLALWPGVISHDFQHEIKQYSEGIYQAAHPVFHTLFLGSLYELGEHLFGSMTAGAALYSVVQLLLLAAMYAYACVFVQHRISNRFAIWLLALLFGALPFHGVLAVSTAKDPLFSGLCVVLCLFLWEIAEEPSAFLHNKAKVLRFALCCLSLALLRHNGLFAYIPACLALLLMMPAARKRMLAIVCLVVLLSTVVPRGLEWSVNASRTPSSELMSIPCQQLMRTAKLGNLPEKEFSQIERWFPGATHTYRAHCADPAKGGNFNYARYQEYPVAFWKTYVKYGLKYPRLYIEAFLENCVGLWYPDDISHAHSLSNEEWEYIYLNTVYPFEADTYPIEPGTKFPSLQKLIYATMHDSRHQNYPVLSHLYCPAIYTLLLLLTTMRLCFDRRRKAALATLPLWGIFLSLLFSAGIFIRYAYPIMSAVPVLFVLAYFTTQQTE